jgi:acyl carrier protein
MKINIEIDTEKDQDLKTIKEIIEYLKSLLK